MPGLPQLQTVIGGFSKTKDTPSIRWQDVDPERKKRLGSVWSQYDVSADPSKNADYLAAYAAATPKAKEIAGANVDWLGKYATGDYDPTESYAKLLGLNKEALGSFLINPALNRLTQERKSAQARAGYGGQGMGTYDALLQDRTLQQLASQAVPNLLGYTNQAYNTAGQLGQENFQNRMGIIGSGEQYRQLDIPALRYLEPTRLARDDVRTNLSNLGAVSTEEDKNRAYYHHKDWLEKLESTVNEIQAHDHAQLEKDFAPLTSLANSAPSIAGSALSSYASAYGGSPYSGGGGGGGGLSL